MNSYRVLFSVSLAALALAGHVQAGVPASSRRLDALAAAGCERQGQKQGEPCSDEAFLRRVCLDLSGAIPNVTTARGFLDSQDPDKRAKLVDDLLASPGYVHRFFHFFADLLRLHTEMRGVYQDEYAQWVRSALRENKPYDRMVKELLTARGPAGDNGAAGFYLRDGDEQRLDTMATTVQVFLGTRIGCAQCHNHPFDHWKQRDFYGMAAYMAGVQTQLKPGREALQEVKDWLKEFKLNEDEEQKVRQFLRFSAFLVSENPRKQLRLPKDYAYKDAEPNSIVKPAVIFGPQPEPKKGQNRLEVFAEWLTAPENPLFARTIANRLWRELLGYGLVEPVDDFNDSNEPYNPELLDFLAAEMVNQRFDLKAFLRMVCNSRTYQLACAQQEVEWRDYFSQAAVLRRMSAEQLWDSFVVLIKEDPEQDPPTPLGARKPYTRLIPEFQRVLVKGDKEQTHQALRALVEGPLRQTKQGEGAMMQKKDRKGGALLARASDLPSPAPFGHFLGDFGQSERVAPGGGDDAATIPQALELLNGKATEFLLAPRSAFSKRLAACSLEEKVETLYLAILSRRPAEREREIATRELQDNRRGGLKVLVHAMLNTREFQFIP